MTHDPVPDSLPAADTPRPRVLRIAGVRTVCGRAEPGYIHGKGLSWSAMTREARERALAAARAELAAEPAARVRALETRHGIPRGYLAERLRRERYAARVGAALRDIRAGHTPLDAARHHGVRLGSVTHALRDTPPAA